MASQKPNSFRYWPAGSARPEKYALVEKSNIFLEAAVGRKLNGIRMQSALVAEHNRVVVQLNSFVKYAAIGVT